MTKSSERPKAGLVQSARQRIARAAYSAQTLLCWHMERRLASEHLQRSRAAYGKQILVTVSRELTASRRQPEPESRA